MWTSQWHVGGCSPWMSIMHWHLGTLTPATSGPPLESECSSSPAEATHMVQCFYPLLMVPGILHMWWAMGCIIMAPVDVSLQPSQHCAPRAITQKFGPWAHQQCAIIHCPREALEMLGVLHIKQGQGIRHAGLFDPVSPVGAPVGRDT